MNLPSFVTDPLFTKSQDYLYGFGTDILAGKLPDFYSTLGKTGGTEFENMLALINRDTAKAVNENLVRRNVSRGGVGLSTIAKATADTGTTLRWSDFLRAQGEKAGLLTTGTNIVSGVGEKALSYGGQQNQFNISKSQLELQQEQIDAQEKAQKNAMWSQILSSAIGAAGTFFGMGGISKALSGLGSAGGGGSNLGSIGINKALSNISLGGMF